MGKNILVASPQVEFNELLRLSLEEGGAYDVFFATTGEETLKTAEDESIDLAILDANITEHSVKTLVTSLKSFNRQLKIIILPPQNNPNHPSLEGLKPDGFLSRPFFKPNLLEMLEEILSKDASPVIGRENQTQESISEVKFDSLDDTMSFSNFLETAEVTENNPESNPENQASDSEKTEDEDFLDLEAELESLISGQTEKDKTLPDPTRLEEDTDTETMLQDVLAQIKSQNVSEDELAFEQELNENLSQQTENEAEQVAEEILENTKQKVDAEEDDLLSNVLAQIKAQSVENEPKDLETELQEALSKSPEVKKVSIKPEDKPIVESQENGSTDELLKDVLAQIKSQSVANGQNIEVEDLESAFTEAEEEKAEPTLPEPDETVEIQKEIQNGGVLNDVLEQLKSQAVSEEKSELELELEEALSKPPERVVISKIPRSVEPLDYGKTPEAETGKPEAAEEAPEDILTKVKSQLQAQSVKDEAFSDIQDEELNAILDEDQEILEIVSDELDTEDISTMLKRSSLEETRPILTSISDEEEIKEEIEDIDEPIDEEIEDSEIDSILHNVLAQLKIQSVENENNEEYSEEERMLVESLESDMASEDEKEPETLMEEEPEFEAEADTEDIFQNVLAQLDKQKSDQVVALEPLDELEQPFDSSSSGLEEIHPYLVKLLDKEGTNAVILAQNSKIISYEGDLTFADIQVLQDILSQNLNAGSRLELARFVKLGEIQEKYLFYATSILGNLSLGIIQLSTIPLSKLRSLTLKTANEFSENRLFKNLYNDLNIGFEEQPIDESEIEELEIEELEIIESEIEELEIVEPEIEEPEIEEPEIEKPEIEEPEIIESEIQELEIKEPEIQELEIEEFEIEEPEIDESILEEDEIKQKTIDDLLEEPETDEIEGTGEEKEDWIPEITETHLKEEQTIEDTQPVKLGLKQDKKVFLKTGYGQISNKLMYPEKSAAFDQLKDKEKHQSIQIKNPKVPSIQVSELESGAIGKDSNWISPVFETPKAEKASEAGQTSEKFPFPETQEKPEVRKFSGSIAERYAGLSKTKISDTARYKALQDSEKVSLDKILSENRAGTDISHSVEDENVDDYLNDILSDLEEENETEAYLLPDPTEEENDNGNGPVLKDLLDEDQPETEIDSLGLDDEFEQLLNEVSDLEDFSLSENMAYFDEQPASFTDDELLEEALQKISSRLDSEKDSSFTIDEKTDGELIQPSDEILPPKKLTEDDLYVVANADGLLEDFLEKGNLEETTETDPEDSGSSVEQSEMEDSSIRIDGDSLNLMDDIYKLFEESATGDTSPIHLSNFETSKEDDFEDYFRDQSGQSEEETQTENLQSNFSDELKFLESLDTQGSGSRINPVQEKRTRTSADPFYEKPAETKTENSSKFDTKKVILEVLSQMDKTEDETPYSENKTDFLRRVSGDQKRSDSFSNDDFESELEAISNSYNDQLFANPQDSRVEEAFSESMTAYEMEPEEKEGDTPTAPVELEREKTSDDFLIDLLPESGSSPISLLNGFPVYTCILVPRLSDYSLTSKYSKILKEAMNQLSQAFGWELDNLIVQPTYMRWTVKVPPEISQGFIVRKVRQFTSDRLFTKFPELSKVNPSENFWAKGYLVVSGTEPPAPEFLDDFISKNRRPKGILNK